MPPTPTVSARELRLDTEPASLAAKQAAAWTEFQKRYLSTLGLNGS